MSHVLDPCYGPHPGEGGKLTGAPYQPVALPMPRQFSGNIVGTCSKCQGPVGIPTIFGSTIPPVPTCQQCGAKKKAPYGPVIEME